MNNLDAVREWVSAMSTKCKGKVVSFYPNKVSKDLGISLNDACDCCTELAKEGLLEIRYTRVCECDYSKDYDTRSSIPIQCDRCGETDRHSVLVKFKFVREPQA